jgi:hypothetical protein
MASQIECPVYLATTQTEGDFANAFRVVQDTGNEWFLDFLYYNGIEAVVIDRIRVPSMFLSAMKERLNAVLQKPVVPFIERGV